VNRWPPRSPTNAEGGGEKKGNRASIQAFLSAGRGKDFSFLERKSRTASEEEKTVNGVDPRSQSLKRKDPRKNVQVSGRTQRPAQELVPVMLTEKILHDAGPVASTKPQKADLNIQEISSPQKGPVESQPRENRGRHKKGAAKRGGPAAFLKGLKNTPPEAPPATRSHAFGRPGELLTRRITFEFRKESRLRGGKKKREKRERS